jgi:hypothetical protein
MPGPDDIVVDQVPCFLQVFTGSEIEPLAILGRSFPPHFRASDETGGKTMWLALVGNAP